MLVGLVSDTHGVWDPALSSHFSKVDCILHAGDVGSHGGAQAVLSHLSQLAPVTAVRGNVDDDEASIVQLPETSVLQLAGWTVLLLHILGSEAAAAAIDQH
jgi:putative phosphoesterase